MVIHRLPPLLLRLRPLRHHPSPPFLLCLHHHRLLSLLLLHFLQDLQDLHLLIHQGLSHPHHFLLLHVVITFSLASLLLSA